VIAVIALLAGLCTPPDPAPVVDVADSAAYLLAGDEARAGGDLRIAAIAYRNAISSDPDNTGAREALAALCRADAANDHDDDTDAGLAAAISVLRGGDLARARTALEAIVARDATGAGAHFFLGMIALQQHDGAAAVRHLALARRDPGYADAAATMSRLAHRDGPLAVTLLAQPELDTNPQLVPDTPPSGATVGPPRPDQSLLLASTFAARPWTWFVVRNALAWRKQRQLSALDFLGENAQAAIELDRRADHLAIRYDLDYDVLDGAPYLIANRGTMVYRRDVGAFAIEVGYALRRRAYQRASEAGFTGWVHRGDLGASVHVTPRFDLELRAVARRELTSDVTFSLRELGGQLAVRARPYDRLRATIATAGWSATYDGAEPDGARRRDVHVDGSLDLEVDLGDHLLAVGGGSLTWNGSTIEDFRYGKVVVRAGLVFAFGVP
jgi:hypothetical protein